ncbi:MAG TPA: hypothetical protein VF456_13070, partial [Vicinamibacterales bacterium]
HDLHAFSLWSPTPVQRLYRRLGLETEALERNASRTIVITGVAWLPLFIFSALDGLAWSGTNIPFLRDFDLQARLLVALPLLVAGEKWVHRQMSEAVCQFLERRIVSGGAVAGFDAAIESALRLSRSLVAELVILIIVYLSGWAFGPSFAWLSGSTWLGRAVGTDVVRTSAGWWYLLVSRPLFQFVLVRWYYRLFLWVRFLWQVSRLRLQLIPTHPDRRAGLGFLSDFSYAFAPFLFAHGTMVAGRVANGVVHAGLTFTRFEVELVVVPLAALVMVLAPELVFTARLFSTRRAGLLQYGALAEEYVREFDNKWIRGHPDPQTLLGSADVQSLADLANSFAVVSQLRLIPSLKESVLTLAVITVLPLAPLPLTVISGSDLFERLVKMML